MNDRPGEMDERDVEERFASIVAAWEPLTEEPGQDRSDPEPPDPDDPAPDHPASGSPAALPPGVNPSPIARIVPASSWRTSEPAQEPPASSAQAAEPDDEHFEPPAVTLPPQEDLHFWGAVLGLVGGPLCLLYVALARPFHSTRWFVAGLVLSLAGFALLVLRSPTSHDEDDDGARV